MYSPLWRITHQKPSVSCTPPFEKSLFLVDAYFWVGVYFGKYGMKKQMEWVQLRGKCSRHTTEGTFLVGVENTPTFLAVNYGKRKGLVFAGTVSVRVAEFRPGNAPSWREVMTLFGDHGDKWTKAEITIRTTADRFQVSTAVETIAVNADRHIYISVVEQKHYTSKLHPQKQIPPSFSTKAPYKKISSFFITFKIPPPPLLFCLLDVDLPGTLWNQAWGAAFSGSR